MKNILLTGSGGFIGKQLKKHLTGKYNLYTPRSYELNLLDRNSVEKYLASNNINLIIHSAAYGVRITPDATIEDITTPNLIMFENLSKFVSKECTMITFGSGAEYNKSRTLHKIKEENFGESIPTDPYGYSKYLISKSIEKLDNILNLRIFGIYGAGENPSRVTSCIINDNLKHAPIRLRQNVVFDFIWVEDFCKIVEYFVNTQTDEKFINVTPTESISILDLAKIVNSFSEYKSEIIIEKSGLNNEYTGNNSKLLSIIKSLRYTTYKEGMQKLFMKYKLEKQNGSER